MKRLVIAIMGLILAMAGVAQAIPSLQLDVGGGTYDMASQTIIAPGSTFDLFAYLIPDSTNLSDDAYYLSIAVVPQTGPVGADLGSFTIDGMTIDVTDDMVYGVPPLEANLGFDAGDLSKHGIFETYYIQYQFYFDPAQQISPYNTQDRAISGDSMPTSGTGMYWASAIIDTTNLNSAYAIHFDLYNIKMGTTAEDVDVNSFAPFSHDAQSNMVPEPSTLLLLGFGLAGMGLYRRMRK